MALNGSILVAIVLLGGNACAQTGERPAISIPEPRHKSEAQPSFTLTAIDYSLSNNTRDGFPTALSELVLFLQPYASTAVKADLEWNRLPLSDARIMQSQFLYMTGWDAIFQISDTEKNRLRDYLKAGGFLFAEDIRRSRNRISLRESRPGVEGTPFDRQFKALMKDPIVLGLDGAKWQKIPLSHPLYDSYWNFSDGPPRGGAPGGTVSGLEMLQQRGRIVVLFSDLNISWYWGQSGLDSTERKRGLEFGGNLIIFAISQRWRTGPVHR